MNKILMPMCHLFGSSHDRSLLKFVSSPVGSRVFWKVPSEFQRDRLHQLEIISCILSLLFLSAMEVQVWSASTFPNCCLCFCSRCGQHLHSFTKLIAWIIHGVPETQSICSLFQCFLKLSVHLNWVTANTQIYVSSGTQGWVNHHSKLFGWNLVTIHLKSV